MVDCDFEFRECEPRKPTGSLNGRDVQLTLKGSNTPSEKLIDLRLYPGRPAQLQLQNAKDPSNPSELILINNEIIALPHLLVLDKDGLPAYGFSSSRVHAWSFEMVFSFCDGINKTIKFICNSKTGASEIQG